MSKQRRKSIQQPQTADGIVIHCAHDAIVKIKELRPHPRNPKKHPVEQTQLLGRIIQATGWRSPITVSTLTGRITKGHGRLSAAYRMRWTEVPVDYQDYESEEVELSDVLADNRISDLASYDMELLMDDLKHLDTMSVNLNLAGFDTAAIDALGVSLDSEDTWLGKDFKLEDGMIEETKPMQKVTFFIHTARKKAFMEVAKGFLDTLDVDEYRIVR